ncbi:MAG: hypothetical protein D6743_18125 [Calditrichaeota bacterium]|nr:MAG: hypothetical protein D6743_18125 [Calditrichota bacterium]
MWGKRKNCLILISLLIIIIIGNSSARGQSGVGGTKSLFSAVGARAMALGNAYVALAADASAVFWNPAGLDYLEKKSATFFYSNLIAGSNYNFVGLVYPTTTIGGFGFGWIRIGTNDVIPSDENAVQGQPGDFSQNQWLFSYGKQLRDNLGIGFSLKLENQNQAFQNVSDTGVGADVAVLYRPDFDNALLRDLSFGLNIQNIISPKARLVEASQSAPLNLKVGLAKQLYFGEEQSSVTLLLDVNKSENAPSTVHFGAEYSFHGQANLRFGFNDGQMAFGAGAAYSNFHFDYTFGKLFDAPEFSGNHRFSVTIDIGKGKTELIRLARQRQEQETRMRVENQLWFEAETDFNSAMEDAREKYYKGDYLGAYVDFSRAEDAAKAMVDVATRLRTEGLDDPEANMRLETASSSLQEAQTFVELANTKSDSVRREEIKELATVATRSQLGRELRDFVLDRREKGNEFFKRQLYSRAIAEWQAALDRINRTAPESRPAWTEDVVKQLENNIATAEKELEGNVKEVIRRADALARRGQYVQALQELNDLRGSVLSQSERQTLENKIRLLQAQLSFSQNFEAGLAAYQRKNWKQAKEAFGRALKIRPRDKKTKEYFEKAEARALATEQAMPRELRTKFLQGIAFYRQKKYEEALKIFEECRKEQPYNKTILEIIDRTEEKLKAK